MLAIANLDKADLRLDPEAADLATLDTLVAFSVSRPNAALREFIGR